MNHSPSTSPLTRPVPLLPLVHPPLPPGAIRPAGWLRRQLQVQAAGLSGHVDQFWPDVADSAWIGGKAEGWERGPYWLDGFIPLAFQLNDPAMIARARRWVDYTLEHQHADGWLGPLKGNPSPSSRLKQLDVWPRFILLKALMQWHEATGDGRVIPAMARFFRLLPSLLDEKPLDEWARVRWADLSLSIYWLYDRTADPALLELAEKVHRQGLNWTALGRDFPYRDRVTQEVLKQFQAAAGGKWINDQFGATHGVNVAMGVKAPGLWYRQSGDARDRDAVHSLLNALDRFHGQPNGMFSCDEHLSGRNPSQGTELCTVVELMFSLEALLSVMPDEALAGRLETIGYNALPATFSPDMWAHQYDQQANQVVCKVSPEHIYTNNGPDSNLFGTEPNFGCCLANMHQGWPKFISSLWMRTADNGLVALSYAPCDVAAAVDTVPVQIEVRGEYPFDEQVSISVKVSEQVRFPLDLRIPAWANGATLAIDDRAPAAVRPGALHRLDRAWAGRTTLRLQFPMALRAELRDQGAVTIHRGPLVFSLAVGEDWRHIRGQAPRADWEVHPTTPWNYALLLEPADPAATLRFETTPTPTGITRSDEGGASAKPPFSADSPFSAATAPVRVRAQGRRVPGWTLHRNAAAAPPPSPVDSGEPLEPLQLIPYGSAKLRITQFPILRTSKE